MSESRWQFSLRGLLLLTTLVSICLAIGVHFAGFMVVFIAIGVTQVTMMLCADWLIRPQNRRALAFATAASWTTIGSGLLILGVRALYAAADTLNSSAYSTTSTQGVTLNDEQELANFVHTAYGASSALGVSLTAAGVVCYIAAIVRWRQLSKRINTQGPTPG